MRAGRRAPESRDQAVGVTGAAQETPRCRLRGRGHRSEEPMRKHRRAQVPSPAPRMSGASPGQPRQPAPTTTPTGLRRHPGLVAARQRAALGRRRTGPGMRSRLPPSRRSPPAPGASPKRPRKPGLRSKRAARPGSRPERTPRRRRLPNPPPRRRPAAQSRRAGRRSRTSAVRRASRQRKRQAGDL